MSRYDTIIDGNNFIAHHLKHGKPLLAGKIGVTELNLLQATHNGVINWMLPRLQHEVENIAGLNPLLPGTVEQHFTKPFIEALKVSDVLCRWSKQLPDFEREVFEQYAPQAYATPLQDLEPYFFDNPWTNQLEGKKVLVISPFAVSIEENYKNIENIWAGKIKKNFELITLQYPFNLKLQPSKYWSTSNDIYEHFIKSIRMQQFDVAIIGTGYTSLMLAAECKRLGKAAIHLGGATQILFGIKGQRWRDIPDFQKMFNKHWTDPYPFEMPEKRQLCEGACYW